MSSYVFRAKPISAVKRDSIRQQDWVHRKQCHGEMDNRLQQDSYNQDGGVQGNVLNDMQTGALTENNSDSTSLHDSAVILTPNLENQHNVNKPGTPNIGELLTPVSHNALQTSFNEPVPCVMEHTDNANRHIVHGTDCWCPCIHPHHHNTTPI